MEVIGIGGNKTDKYSGISIEGLSVTCNFTHKTSATAFTGDIQSLLALTAVITLNRNGSTLPIYNGPLRDIIAGTNFLKNGFQAFCTDQTTFGKVTLVQTTGVFETIILPFVIPFGSVINLKDSDRLDFQLSWVTAGATVGASSTITIDAIQGVGVEYATPQFASKMIDASSPNFGGTTGKNTTRIVFLNFDKKTYLTADNVLNSVQLQSDKIAKVLNTGQIIGENQYSHGMVDGSYEPFQSFEIYSGKPLLNSQLNLTFTPSNVTTANNVVFVHTLDTNKWLVKRGATMSQKHYNADVSNV